MEFVQHFEQVNTSRKLLGVPIAGSLIIECFVSYDPTLTHFLSFWKNYLLE